MGEKRLKPHYYCIYWLRGLKKQRNLDVLLIYFMCVLVFQQPEFFIHLLSLCQTQALPLPPGQSLWGSSGMLLHVKSSSCLSTHDIASIDSLFQPDLTRSKKNCVAEQHYSLPTDSPVFDLSFHWKPCVKRAMPNETYPKLNADFVSTKWIKQLKKLEKCLDHLDGFMYLRNSWLMCSLATHQPQKQIL